LNKNPQARNANIVVQETKNETLIYDLNINKAYCLNQTSSIVWKSCDGKTTVSEIRARLSKELRADADEELVRLALEDLRGQNLLTEDASASYLSGISRRDAIKKAGMAAMIALPIIASVGAPKAVTAQSGCAPPEMVCGVGCCEMIPFAQDCCSGVCTPLGTDANCIACGDVCGAGDSCFAGVGCLAGP